MSTHQIDVLETRVLFAAQIAFGNFADTAHLVGNGFGGASISQGNRLRLTDDNVQYQARSVWYDTAVDIKRFRSDFSFQTTGRADTADGITFTIQNTGTSALGAFGQDLGYAGIDKSEAVTFNLYNLGAFGSKFDFASNGERPGTTDSIAPLNLHNGHVFKATVAYDGTTLQVSVSDAKDRSKVFTASKQIDLAAAVGGDTAIVGFTGGTGQFFATQEILSWDFESGGNSAPTLASSAPVPDQVVTTDRTTLSTLGEDDGGEQNLTYTWSIIDKPGGAKDPVFSANGTNGAKSITAQFFKEGQYTFRCTITDQDGLSTTTDVNVRVKATPTRILIDPHGSEIGFGERVNYNAVVQNQFYRAMKGQDIKFSVDSIAGTINEDTGVFTASDSQRGHVQVFAKSGDLTGIAGATVHPDNNG